ncbi:uncharacterized protein LAJ45_09540 [Morchella importuna]|uniref:uncharacterized protein n=1 Tax=Morchella importuna TaxID=1174673 RepID=UPI001E8DE806|nr:uncharacterized protein LAJ45_09540 [Morchella importuna]KAH8146347.1 hypothetical protein LAJ45_09540 [Morchella importuna]
MTSSPSPMTPPSSPMDSVSPMDSPSSMASSPSMEFPSTMESPLSMESSSSTDSPSSMESPPSMESPSSMESTSPMASQFSTEPTPPPPKPKSKPKPTHFLCLPLGHNPPLTPAPSPFNETLLTMTNTLTSYLHQDQKVVLTSAIRPASALMIPLGQLSLPTYAAERAAIKLLNEINFRYLVRQVTWGGGYETIETDLRGLETGSGKWRTGVLYTVPTGNKIADGYERLRDFVAAVRKEFFDRGFLIPEPRYKEEQDPSEEVKLPEIKLKVTVVNTVYSGDQGCACISLMQRRQSASIRARGWQRM